MSRVDAYRELHPQCDSDEQAVSKLIDIDRMAQILAQSEPANQAPAPAVEQTEDQGPPIAPPAQEVTEYE